ncbi:Transposase InsO and inactivated derivatives [Amycolatopsis lurida]|uniref:IS481 family transposase n=1 Tax=Amycolatopsis lurida TaxID=31959 RepID=UPI0005AD557D|nr:Transposase InsO and inactivated derivatives [Amycolatopsis lurida]
MDEDFDDRTWRIEHRRRAVMEVLDGVPVAQVARQFGTSRQSVHAWLKRFETEGEQGLVERSVRPKTSPTRLSADVEALVCELRRSHPRWGPRRIAHELGRRGVSPAPGRTTVYRVLVRNNLVEPQEQQHRRKYQRWQRDAPMQLWQLDIMGGVFLADGRECKLVTGIDDHSRFIVITQVVVEPSGRAVCQAFTDAMARYGVPSEVLTDNGKQFTGRFTKPFPAEVLFEQICRENGITARLTKPRSPTTTGKIERWHQSLRRELLDECGPFESLQAAQAAIEAWAHGYNYERPHQSLGMVTPASLFRPARALTRVAAPEPEPVVPPDTRRASARSEPDAAAVELDMVISPGGRLCLPGNQQVKFNQSLAGRAVIVWADHRSIHVILDGELIRTRSSRLSTDDLAILRLRSARPAGPEPGTSAGKVVGASVVEVDRTVGRDGNVNIGGQRVLLAAHLAGQQVTLRLDGHLMHVVAAGKLAKTLPSPIPPEARSKVSGARAATSPLPPPPAPPLRALRKVPADGITMVAGQRLRVGRPHAGKTVTVVIEDTVFRVLHNDIELSTHARKTTKPIGRLRSHANSVAT